MNRKQIIIGIIAEILAALMLIILGLKASAAAPTVNSDGTLTINKVQKEPEVYQPYSWGEMYDEPMSLTDEEYDLLCRVLCLEDGGESEWSQKCVASTIYNRIKSGIWGDTVSDVLYAEGQYEVMPNVWTAEPSELTKAVITEVFLNGNVVCPARVMFFRTGYYFSWARAEFNVGNVYFSSSWWYQR